MSVRPRSWFSVRLFAAIGGAAVGLALAVPLLRGESLPTIRMSAGPAGTKRHEVAEYLCDQAAGHNLQIRLVESAGSEECLDLVKAGRLDAAVVSNGIIIPDSSNVTVLAALRTEAVHVLVRKELLQPGRPIVEAIRGRRVNVGQAGSTERLLAKEFLEFARLRAPADGKSADVIPTELTKGQLLEQCRAIQQAAPEARAALQTQLPDCLLIVASMPSALVQALVEAADYEIVPLPATRAFLMDNLQHHNATQTVLYREFLEDTTIPPHCYFAHRGLPSADCETVGVRLLVVARKDLPSAAVKRLMETLYEGEFAHRIQTQTPRQVPSPYVMHPAALAYLDRDKPLASNAVLEWITNSLSIFGAFSAGALSLYSLFWRRKTREPSYYYAEIRKVEQLAVSGDAASDALSTHEFVQHLDRRLLELRQQLIADICEGRLKSDPVIANILALLKEARRNLLSRDLESTAVASFAFEGSAPAGRGGMVIPRQRAAA